MTMQDTRPPRTCQEVQEDLLTYIHSEVDQDARKLIEVHLQDCHTCSRECAVETLITTLIRQACLCEAPPGLRERLREDWSRQQVQERTELGHTPVQDTTQD